MLHVSSRKWYFYHVANVLKLARHCVIKIYKIRLPQLETKFNDAAKFIEQIGAVWKVIGAIVYELKMLFCQDIINIWIYMELLDICYKSRRLIAMKWHKPIY